MSVTVVWLSISLGQLLETKLNIQVKQNFKIITTNVDCIFYFFSYIFIPSLMVAFYDFKMYMQLIIAIINVYLCLTVID